MTSFERLGKILEKIDSWRNQALYFILKPLWPSQITPNMVSWFRIFLGVLLLVLLFWFGIEDKLIIVTIFFIGIFTDFIDGPIARCKDKATEFGAILDPVADRILIIPIAAYSLFKYHKWLLLFLLLMEILEFFVTALAKSKGLSAKSNIFGKTKMVLESLVFVAILIIWPVTPFQFLFAILWLSIPLSLFSTMHRIGEVYKLNSNHSNAPQN
ncbi:MAG: CDP-alcohol phosphatidyltransferase family protein [Candidatus Pacebacteria bacterium]|nr:CDP-alcohol phosphatidyltransferase family protein [Candidatus Paceibacterota bacterium]